MNKYIYDALSILLIAILWIPVTIGCGLYHMYWIFVQYPEKAFELSDKIWNEQ